MPSGIAAGLPVSAAPILKGLVTEDDWITFTTSPAGAGAYRKVGPFVEVSFETTANVSAAAVATIFTLPSGYRPSRMVTLAASGGVDGDREANGQIDTAGVISVRNNYSSATVVQGYALFVAA